MLILLIISIILGAIVAGVTGIGFLFWVVSIAIFIFGLPGALIGGFIHGENEYAQDMADYRELMRSLDEDMRQDERELAKDIRMNRYLDKLEDIGNNSNTYIDKRQIHFNNYSNKKKKRTNKKLDD